MQNEVFSGSGVYPLAIVEANDSGWQAEHDVLVVGFGAAGASAAIEAADGNADVAIIDRFTGGGSTALSGSVYYAGGGTALQKKLGLDDSPDNMFRYLKYEVGSVVADATLKRFCDQSPANFDWIEKQGVSYSGDVFTIKTTHPRPEYSLYYSGNELLGSAIDDSGATSVPRGHVADGNAKATGLGSGFFKPLGRTAGRRVNQFYSQSCVRRLLINPQGELVGVELSRLSRWSLAGVLHRLFNRVANLLNMASPPASAFCRGWIQKLEKRAAPMRIRARQGVILSAGGFIFNRQMVAEHLPEFLSARMLGQAGDNGAGIALGHSAGGALAHMDSASSWRFINPPKSWPKGVIVNLQGRRYCNEASYGAVIGTAMYRANRGEGVLILDSNLYEQSMEHLKRDARAMIAVFIKRQLKTAKKADTLPALATLAGIQVDGLLSTIEHYNLAAQGGQQDPFRKSSGDMAAIVRPPFYAIDIAAGGSPSLSLGGLVVDEQTGNVKTEAGENIPGLYAAGRTAVGVASNNYVSGLSIADGVFSGRRAGKHAAQRLTTR